MSRVSVSVSLFDRILAAFGLLGYAMRNSITFFAPLILGSCWRQDGARAQARS